MRTKTSSAPPLEKRSRRRAMAASRADARSGASATSTEYVSVLVQTLLRALYEFVDAGHFPIQTWKGSIATKAEGSSSM